MSQENLEVVKRAIAALNDHDVESYLAFCTADVQLETPITPSTAARPSKPWGCRSETLTPTPEPAGY